MVMMQTPAASVVEMVVITISNGDDIDADSERNDDGNITISNLHDVHADSERGDDGNDHFEQWRWCRHRPRLW